MANFNFLPICWRCFQKPICPNISKIFIQSKSICWTRNINSIRLTSVSFSTPPFFRIGLFTRGQPATSLCKPGQWFCRRAQNCSSRATTKNKSDFSRLFQLARPEKWNLTGAVGLLLVSSTVTMALPFCMGRIIDIIYTSPKEVLSEKLTTICQILATVFLIGAVANFGRFYLMSMSGQRIINRLRTTVYDSILRQEIGFFDKVKTGELVNRLSADTSAVGYSISTNISDGLRSTFAVITGVGMMVYTSNQLALVGLAIVPPVALAAVIYGRYLRQITKSVQDSLAQATQVAEEHIANIRTVRAFAQEDRESDNYRARIMDVLSLAKKESLARATFFGTAGLSGNLVVLTVLYYGGTMMSSGEISVGDLASFLMYAAYVGIYIGGLSSFYSETMRAIGASTRLWELVDRIPQIPLLDGRCPTTMQGNIEFDNITFSYPNRPEAAILQNLTLDIPSGSVVAVVGPSGSGKSTLAALLLRFYDPQSGQVVLDGSSIESLEPTWLRKQIGLVSQDPVLFSGTIRENIKYGSEDRNPSEEDVKRAAQEANAWEFIEHFPDGLNTLVGERGVMLSGGQRQRVTIARALIKNPKVLMLDEATSALDAKSEYLVQEALERLMKGRTVITIAHRLSTILKADKIAVLDQGKIVEVGKYHQLMAIPAGRFRQLMEKQTVAS